MRNCDHLNILKEIALSLRAYKAEFISVGRIKTDSSFRKLCSANSCGNYGGNYMCPPNVEPVNILIQRLMTYKLALVYQTLSPLEDSFDFHGMIEAGNHHNIWAQKLWDKADSLGMKALYLGAGGCRLCEICAIKTEEPCRHSERVMPSYGIDVAALAAAANMQYINGANTVTYFGAVLI